MAVAFAFLNGHDPASIHDPYTLALVSNALLAMGSVPRPHLERLAEACGPSDYGVYLRRVLEERRAADGGG